ncbi:MAG TPA: CaiB/BaiF CoA-transferase family protein [Dehalococcoidia bacterium]|nr:CaiB/BaiF CoA-transferase family protein [Dehalococcoidia bacterium]
MASPLDGLRIISMAEQYPGPYCTLLLADMGADVVLVERPRVGDPSRGPGGMSDFFAALNRNKRSVTIDLKTEEGREALKRLVAKADVFLEGFRPSTMGRLGLGYETLRELNPRLVYCSLSGFGQSGPYRLRPAHDISFQGIAGLLANLIDRGSFADRPGVAIGDLSSGMFAAIGILAALYARERGGSGQYVDVAMADGLVSWMTTALTPVINGKPAFNLGDGAGYGVYKAADGKFLTLSVATEPHFWRNLWQTVGRPDLTEISFVDRLKRNQELDGILREVFLTKSRDEWVELLAAGDVPSGPVFSLEEVARDPQLRERGMIVEWEAPDGRKIGMVNQPIQFSETPAGIRRPAPALGEHTEEVLREAGYGDEELARLREKGAV